MKKILILIVPITMLFSFSIVQAQKGISAPPPSGPVANVPQGEVKTSDNAIRPEVVNVANEGGWLSEREFSLSLLILSFSLVLILLIILAKRIGGIDISSDQFLRLVSIILIIVASLLIIPSGFNDKQISAVVGLLGTLAGYLLGRRDSSDK